METAEVTAALLLCALGGVSSWIGERHAGERKSHDARDYFPKAPQKTHPFDPRDFPRFALSGVHKGRPDPDPDPRPEHDPRAVFFIPVKFDFDRGPTARSLAPEPSYDADSPRLIMDKDFNIRFDNPYIVPLTKPLALVLDSRAVARARDGASSEKMMIPFPVLVKARKPLLDSEGFRDYRDEDEVAEHRSADFDDERASGPPAKPPRRDAPVPKIGKKWKNGTTARTKYVKKTTLHSLEDERPREGAGYKPKFELDRFNGSVDSSDLYPGKIFADMYRNMPTFDSEESREAEPPRYASSTAKTPRTSSEAASPPWRPRTSEYPGSERLFSAATDLEWVTHANSSKARTPAPAHHGREARIVIRDVIQEDVLAPETTTARPEEVTISKKFWRTV